MKHVLIAGLILGLSACGSYSEQTPKEPRVSADLITEIALADVPASVSDLVTQARPDFVMTEVLKKDRGPRTYYDVEGKLPNGDEIEFDVLMGASGPEIVEIQRDINWSDVPEAGRVLVNAANEGSAEIARVIESTQTDGAIIYEVFIEGHNSDPRFEVYSKEAAFKLLSTRWEH